MSSKSAKRIEPMCGCNPIPMERTDPRAYVMPQDFRKEAENPPEVTYQLELLQKNVETLANTLNSLIVKLDPVLSSKRDGNQNPVSLPQFCSSLGANIGDINSKIDDFCEAVSDTIERLQL